MLSSNELLIYALATLALVISPGPNMLYCVSRAISQGRWAGFVSVLGVQLGVAIHMLAAMLGLSAVLLAVPWAFDVIKWAGAAYLLWLAWQAVKPGGRALFEPQQLPRDSNWRLFQMGLVTNLLNPKMAVFCMSIFPQFIHPERGDTTVQFLQLLATHVSVSTTGNTLIACSAGTLSVFLQQRPSWMTVQRYLMGGVLAALALKLAVTERK